MWGFIGRILIQLKLMFNINFPRKTAAPESSISIGGKNIKLVVGLGNPGEKYKDTYHNVGTIFMDSLLKSYNNEVDRDTKWKRVKSFLYARTNNVILAKSDTYMNRSGKSVSELLRYFNVKPEEIMIVHDDTDISLGEYKISYDRGSAGHNGIESVMKSVKDGGFLRLRIGVRHNDERAGEFVLKHIKSEQLDSLEQLFNKIGAVYFKI